VTLVRRSDGRVQFLVRENLADGDEEIIEYDDEDDPAILCTRIRIPSPMESTSPMRLMFTSPSITTNTMSSAMLTQIAVRTATVSFATGCEGSGASQNTTYRAI
jgi:hypothetical protein